VTFLSREEDEQTLFSFFLTRRQKAPKSDDIFSQFQFIVKTHTHKSSIIGTSKEEEEEVEERREERFRALVEENDSRANNDFVMVSGNYFFFYSFALWRDSDWGILSLLVFLSFVSSFFPQRRLLSPSLCLTIRVLCSFFGVFAFPRDDAKKYIRRLLRVRIRVQSRRTRSRWR